MKPSQCLPAQKSGRRKIGNTEQNKYSYPHPRNTPKSQKNLWLTADDSRRKELKAMSKSKEESIEIAITEAPKKTEWGAGSVEEEEEKGGLAGMLLNPLNPLAMMDGQE